MRLFNLKSTFVTFLVFILSIYTSSIFADGLDLLDVHFINSSEGWAVGDSGLVVHTTNGGETWTQQLSGTDKILTSVIFIGPLNGWTVGQRGTILHTTDGGSNWVNQSSGQISILTDVHFLNINEGWIAGYDGIILHTTDGGNLWTQQNTGTNSSFQCIYFTDELHGWAGGIYRIFYRTTDGGQTWESLNPNPTPGVTYYGIQFTDNLHGWRSGGGLSYTTDGGDTWTNCSNYFGRDIQMLDQNIGYAVGALSTVQKTTNGVDWIVDQIGYANQLNGVSFTDAMTGWTVGQYGLILHTTDGGETWNRQVSGRFGYGLFGGYYTPPGDTIWYFISDLELVTDVIEVTIPEEVLQIYTLVDVEITIDSVLHPSVSDLEFYLTHNGITDTFIYQSSCNGENFFNTTLSDMGANSISSGSAPYTGIYTPDQPLSMFAGMDPTGEWTLGIYDGMVGNTGQFKGWGLHLYFETPVDVNQESSEIIQNFQLSQNYPNPFNPSTRISWQSPVGSWQTLKVYDVLGNEIVTLVDEYKPAGTYEVEFSAKGGYASGVYFYQLKINDFIETKKMVLLR